MSGSLTSMAKVLLPSSLSAVSSRFIGLPAIFQSFGSLSLMPLGSGASSLAAAANIVLRGTDTAAAAGRHLAPDAFACEVLPGRDLFRLYFVPIAFELFGDELDEARDRALSHLRARDTDHAGIVGFDENPGIDFGAFIGALRNCRTEARRQIESECESTARGGGADDERPARKPRGFAADRLCHGRPP